MEIYDRSSPRRALASWSALVLSLGSTGARAGARSLWLAAACAGLIILLAVRPTPVFSQSVSRVSISHVDATHLPDVRVIVGVLDGEGSPVTNLRAANFAVYQDGSTVPIASAEPSTEPMTIVLALDTSGSMNDRDAVGHVKIDESRQAAEGFVTTINSLTADSAAAPDVLSVMSFNDRPTIASAPSTDHNQAINAIRGLRADAKWTALYDAAFQAVKTAESAAPGERAVVLFTDGNDEGPNGKPASTVQLDDVISLAQRDDVPIYTIGFGADIDQQVLGRLAALTGGSLSTTSDATKLTGLFKGVATQLKSKYIVSFSSCASATDHAIQVEVQDGGRIEGLDQVNAHYNAVPPVVQVWEPKDGAEIQGPVDLVPGFGACLQNPIVGVVFQVNDHVVGSADHEPWVVHWDSGSLPPGQSEIDVRAVDAAGLAGTHRVAVTIVPPLPTAAATATAPPTTEPPLAPLLAPTAVPTVVPTPADTPRSAAGIFATSNRIVFLTLVLALIGLLLIILALVLVVTRPRAVDSAVNWTNRDPMGPPASSGAPTVAFANLTGIKGDGVAGKVFPIGDRAVLGRDSLCDVSIDDPSRTLSRRHAEIRREERGFVLYDLDSRNGTHVGADAARGGDGVLLSDDVEITLGARYVLQFSETVDNDGSLMTLPIDPGDGPS